MSSAVFDEAVQQHHDVAFQCEQYSRDTRIQPDPHFPDIAIQMCYQRHSERPAELHGLYIFAYGFIVCRRKSTQPLTNRLIAGIGLKEADFQGRLFHVAFQRRTLIYWH